MLDVNVFIKYVEEAKTLEDKYAIQRAFLQELATGEIKSLQGAVFLAKLINDKK